MEVLAGITLLVGGAYAGKTTYASETGVPHVNGDAIRDELTGGRRWEADREEAAQIFADRVREAVESSPTVVIEWSFWASAADRRWLRELARKLGRPLHLVVFDNLDEQAARRAEASDAGRLARTQLVFERWPALREELKAEVSEYASVRWRERTRG